MPMTLETRTTSSHPYVLCLRPGEVVRVRPAAEIFNTLDEHGTLDGLPFMPEMLKYCGRKWPLSSSAPTTCAPGWGTRRMHNTPSTSQTFAVTERLMVDAKRRVSCSGRKRGSNGSSRAAEVVRELDAENRD